MHTVQQLREQGNKVRVIHFRYPADEFVPYELIPQREAKEREIPLSTHGGQTEVEITTKSGNHFRGVARCNPQDQYNRKIALKIAIGRALNGQKLS